MAVDLSSHLNKSPEHVNEGSFESVSSAGVIISAFASKHKDPNGTPNYFSLNSFMEQSPTIPDSPLSNVHRHTPNHLVLSDTTKNGYFTTNTNNQNSPTFQRGGSINNNNLFSAHSPQRSDFEISPRQQQQETILLTHSGMFDAVSTTSNAYNHSSFGGVFGGSPANIHTPANLLNSSVDMKPSMQALQPHPFYTHSALTASHDQSAVQRSAMSPLLANPMGYRAYPQINELFPPRAEFYAQQTPFGHPQYW